jgi:aconitate hydratase
MLRRSRKIIEYYGEGENLSVMDRHVIANMGALGATTTVFPSDNETKRF